METGERVLKKPCTKVFVLNLLILRSVAGCATDQPTWIEQDLPYSFKG